jgi:hypothetical protein
MNLIERYATEVGKNLPRKMRADIETEIRSTLEDMLEERSQTVGRPADNEMAKALLKEYGAPDKVAATYLPERYLIGPKLFPIFTLVLKIVFSVLTVLALVGFGIHFGQNSLTAQSFIEIFGRSLLEYLGGMISAFGNIVFIFAILQWALPASEFEDKEQGQTWDPSTLTKEPEPDEVRTWEPIWAIVFTAAALLIFNFYPQIIGVGFASGGKWIFAPALSETFFNFLPWLDGIWILQIILNVLLLRAGRWTKTTRWFSVGIQVLGIALANALLMAPSLVGITHAELTSLLYDTTAAATLLNLINSMVKIGLVLAIVFGSVEVFKTLYRLFVKPTHVKAVVTK